MSEKSEKIYVNGGIGFCGLLTIVFIVLKFLNVISWSWVWVLSPIWICAIIYLVLVILVLTVISRHNK